MGASKPDDVVVERLRGRQFPCRLWNLPLEQDEAVLGDTAFAFMASTVLLLTIAVLVRSYFRSTALDQARVKQTVLGLVVADRLFVIGTVWVTRVHGGSLTVTHWMVLHVVPVLKTLGGHDRTSVLIEGVESFLRKLPQLGALGYAPSDAAVLSLRDRKRELAKGRAARPRGRRSGHPLAATRRASGLVLQEIGRGEGRGSCCTYLGGRVDYRDDRSGCEVSVPGLVTPGRSG